MSRRFSPGPGGYHTDPASLEEASERATAKNKRMYQRARADKKRKEEFQKQIDDFNSSPPPVLLIKKPKPKIEF